MYIADQDFVVGIGLEARGHSTGLVGANELDIVVEVHSFVTDTAGFDLPCFYCLTLGSGRLSPARLGSYFSCSHTEVRCVVPGGSSHRPLTLESSSGSTEIVAFSSWSSLHEALN